MADYKVTDTELTSIANAIRTKGGTQAQLEFPTGFVSAVQAIPTGGGGGAIILTGTANPQPSVGADGDLYFRYGLDGYTPVEYIQSDGNQYINLGYVPTLNTKVKLKINPQVINESGILGSKWALNGFFLMFLNNKIRWHCQSSIDSPEIVVNTDLLIEVENGKLTVDGTDYAVSPSSFIYNYPLSVFYTTDTTGISPTPPKGQFKLYYLELYENDNIVKHYIPVKRNSDDKLGLYELFAGMFFTNTGTGEFLSGDEITDSDYVNSTFCKVNGVWKPLIGTNINDINLGGN